MLVRHFFTPGLFVNSYLVFDEVAKVGVVIDPTRRIEDYLACALKEGIKITDIVETHVHADFISGAPELKGALEGKATIHCSGAGGREWIPAYANKVVKDRDVLQLGNVKLEAWHTPGHTPEHMMWVAYDGKCTQSVPQAAFTGDLLFVGSVGRPDLLGKEATASLAKQLYHSLFAVLSSLPDFVEVYPGHGAGSLCGKGIGPRLSSTIGYEKQCNPWLIPQQEAAWLHSLQLTTLPIPHYFLHMKKINVQRKEVSNKHKAPTFISKEDLTQLSPMNTIIDVRRPDDFAEGNLAESINIPFAPSFSLWAATVLPPDKEFILVVDHPEMLGSIIQSLSLVGLDRISGIIDVSDWNFFDKKAWFIPSPALTAGAFQQEKDKFYLLDVRTEKEWMEGHISGAHHLEFIQAAQQLSEIPIEQPVAVICHSGNRASIIASLLKKERGAVTFNIQGGMQAWNKILS